MLSRVCSMSRSDTILKVRTHRFTWKPEYREENYNFCSYYFFINKWYKGEINRLQWGIKKKNKILGQIFPWVKPTKSNSNVLLPTLLFSKSCGLWGWLRFSGSWRLPIFCCSYKSFSLSLLGCDLKSTQSLSLPIFLGFLTLYSFWS